MRKRESVSVLLMLLSVSWLCQCVTVVSGAPTPIEAEDSSSDAEEDRLMDQAFERAASAASGKASSASSLSNDDVSGEADASYEDLWPRFAEAQADAAPVTNQQQTNSTPKVLPNQYFERKQPLSRMCDLTAEHGICVNGGQKVLTGDSVVKGTILRMSFDDLLATDASGNGHHSAVAVAPGAPLLRGASAAVRGAFVEVPSSKLLMDTVNKVSAAFWLFVKPNPHPEDRWCTILHIGRQNNYAVSLLHNEKTRALQVSLHNNAVSFVSDSLVTPGSWHHVAISFGKTGIILVFNGILDHFHNPPVSPAPKLDSAQFYLGRPPWVDSQTCSVEMYVDDLQLFSRPLSIPEIQAMSFPALGSFSPNFVRFACRGCTYENANNICSLLGESIHMCSNNELLMGGYYIAQRNGWNPNNLPFFKKEKKPKNVELAGVGLCCSSF